MDMWLHGGVAASAIQWGRRPVSETWQKQDGKRWPACRMRVCQRAQGRLQLELHCLLQRGTHPEAVYPRCMSLAAASRTKSTPQTARGRDASRRGAGWACALGTSGGRAEAAELQESPYPDGGETRAGRRVQPSHWPFAVTYFANAEGGGAPVQGPCSCLHRPPILSLAAAVFFAMVCCMQPAACILHAMRRLDSIQYGIQHAAFQTGSG